MSTENKPIRHEDGHLVYKRNKDAVKSRTRGVEQVNMSKDINVLQRQIRRAFAYINILEERISNLEGKGDK